MSQTEVQKAPAVAPQEPYAVNVAESINEEEFDIEKYNNNYISERDFVGEKREAYMKWKQENDCKSAQKWTLIIVASAAVILIVMMLCKDKVSDNMNSKETPSSSNKDSKKAIRGPGNKLNQDRPDNIRSNPATATAAMRTRPKPSGKMQYVRTGGAPARRPR